MRPDDNSLDPIFACEDPARTAEEEAVSMSENVAARQAFLELGQGLLGWKIRALAVYGGLAAESVARSTLDCVLADSIDPAIEDLVRAARAPGAILVERPRR